MNDLVHRFDILGKEYNLNIYKKEILQNFIIGLDELRKKLFVFKKVAGQIRFCNYRFKGYEKSVQRKRYIKARWSGRQGTEGPKNIWIKSSWNLSPMNRNERVQVAFYDSEINNSTEIYHLDKRGGEWERELSEKIDENLKEIAWRTFKKMK